MIDSNGKDLSSFSMLDLFRSEMEVHAATLNDSLLALESDSNALSGSSRNDTIESLMRAAHSIKGGARIVELDAAVKLAHTMEDCFVAIQKGDPPLESGLRPEHIDVLLKGVDMLIQIAEYAGDDLQSQKWRSENQQKIDTLIAEISAILTGQFIPSEETHKPHVQAEEPFPPASEFSAPSIPSETPKKQTPPLPEPSPPPDMEDGLHTQPVDSEPSAKIIQETPQEALPPEPPPPREQPQQMPASTRQYDTEKDRMVKVTATKIERLMGLAGEVVVSSRWLPPFSESLIILKKSHSELLNLLERLQEMLEKDAIGYTSDKKNLSIIQGSKGWKQKSKSDTRDYGQNRLIRKLVARARGKAKECNHHLLDRLNRLDMFTSSSETLSDRLYHEIISVRMRPFSDGIQAFPRMVRDLSRELGKKVRFDIIGKSTEVDRDILEKLEAPLSHLLRNALDHGLEPPDERINNHKPETGTLTLEASHRSGMLMITVSDDGRGIEPEALRRKILQKGLTNAEMVDKLTETELMEFLFLPGFSTLDSVTEISGRGVGLDVVHNMVHEVRGIVRAVSKPGKGLTFHLELPLTLSVVRTFIVEIANETYAFPLARIDRCLILFEDEIETVEDRQYFRLGSKNISLVDIHDVLEVAKPSEHRDKLSLVVISDRVHSYGLVVDRFLGEYDLVVRPLDPRLGKVSDISSMAVMLDGSPVLIFDVEDLVRSIDGLLSGQHLQKISYSKEINNIKVGKHILVVDDSITVREMERKLLESKGYKVDVAVDGMEAWNLLRTAEYDMVVSDIDMPRMNGFELISHIKQHEKLKSLPVMVVSYKNKEQDRLRGLEAGANYYLTKSSFQDNSFIEAVTDLIGEA